MKYLPFERIIYRTKLSEQEIITRLSGFVEPKKFSFGKTSTKEYEGSINDKRFEINRVINYRNSFLPQLTGIIQKDNYGTQIEVTMKLHVFVFVFLIFWCGFVMFFLISLGVVQQKISVFFLVPVGMLLFVYALTMLGFKTESKKSKEFLMKSFEAEIIDGKINN
ncbi:hypothetical protein B0A69_20890 [Chryseobacterium shigense]|uniref:Uncharacterized protein n=1 Tax=Chryseobacterium shigense TaxID=297244 RepID=A0A1N7I6C1_9FLAO|nr:hypothetical protein [Chryseobacterium shigense]PQA90135.1 hypothetical protein B0A69_20890 [Chryseobacterium shigense]SIS32625.1 hypothetical protein SAMN05421639_102321 [Chryseobacterium shigense]